MDEIPRINYPGGGRGSSDSYVGRRSRTVTILSADGRRVQVDGDEVGTGDVPGRVPFALVDASNDEDGNQIRVIYGYILDVLTSSVSGGGMIVPTGMTEEDGFIVDASASTGDIYLHTVNTVDATTGQGELVSAEIVTTDGGNDETNYYLPLGSWSTDGDGNLVIVGPGTGNLGWLFANWSYFWSISGQ